MNNPKIRKFLYQIITSYKHIIALFKEQHWHFNNLIYLIGIFQTELNAFESLKKLDEYQDDTLAFLEIIQNACQNFEILCQLLHKRVWPSISLSLDLKNIFYGINQFIKAIYNNIYLLNIDINFDIKFSPEELDSNMLEDVFMNLYSYFVEAKRQEEFNEKEKERINSQLDQISVLCDHFGVNKPSFQVIINSKTLLFPFKTFVNDNMQKWEFNTEILTDRVKTKSFKDFPILPFKTNDNRTVLKYEFKKTNSDNHKRQFMLLSAIKNANILKFLGGSIKGELVTCIFEYFPDMAPLSNRIKDISDSPKTLTIIAYQIAEGFRFLHSNNIIHGSLNLQSILFRLPSQGIYTYIWNFGLSNRVGVDYKILPPEFYKEGDFNPELGSNDGIYTFETDVYQYGLLLYHIGKLEELYSNVSLDKIKEIICDPNNRPSFDGKNGEKYFSDGLKKLIEDCLNIDPSKRPTFKEILERFETTKLYYINEKKDMKAVLNVINNIFYQICFPSRLKSPTSSSRFNSILEKYQDADEEEKNRIANGLLKMFSDVVDEKNSTITQINEIKNMNDYGFFWNIIPLFMSQNDQTKEKLTESYTKLVTILKRNKDFDLNKFINDFLTQDGDNLICQFLIQEGQLRDLTLSFLDAINENIVDEDEKPLSIITLKLIEIKKLKNICQIVKKINPNIRSNILSPIIKDLLLLFNPEYYDDSSFLIESYLDNSNEIIDIGSISPTNVLRSGKFKLLQQLMKIDNFLSSIQNDDCNEAIRIIISDDAGQAQKECAFLLCLGLDKEFYSVIAKYDKIVDKALKNENQELASRFIARLTLFSRPCEYILSKLEEDPGKLPYKSFIELNNPWYLVSLSRIAGFFPNRVSKLPNLKENLIKNLNQMDLLEGTLRFLGVISTEIYFWDDCEVAKSLILLLNKNSTTYLETSILLSVISNITSIKNVKEFFSQEENYFEFLSIAENEGKNSGICLRVLSCLTIPENTNRGKEILDMRLVEVVQRHLENGDKFGIDGSARLIIEMIKYNEKLKTYLNNANIANLLIMNASNENQDINIFIDLMRALNVLGNGRHSEVVSLFSNMIMSYHGILPNEFYMLKDEMST